MQVVKRHGIPSARLLERGTEPVSSMFKAPIARREKPRQREK
jgi:hypothetical protein